MLSKMYEGYFQHVQNNVLEIISVVQNNKPPQE